MRVNIQEPIRHPAGAEAGFEITGRNVDLLECFPEAAEYAEALAELERTGTLMVGGGAEPLFKLTVA
jgi:hypothetical protein